MDSKSECNLSSKLWDIDLSRVMGLGIFVYDRISFFIWHTFSIIETGLISVNFGYSESSFDAAILDFACFDTFFIS